MADPFRKMIDAQRKSIKLGKIDKSSSHVVHNSPNHRYYYFHLQGSPSHNWKVLFKRVAASPAVAISYDFDDRSRDGTGPVYLCALAPDLPAIIPSLISEAEQFVTYANEHNKHEVDERESRIRQREREKEVADQQFGEGVDRAQASVVPAWVKVAVGISAGVGLIWLLIRFA